MASFRSAMTVRLMETRGSKRTVTSPAMTAFPGGELEQVRAGKYARPGVHRLPVRVLLHQT